MKKNICSALIRWISGKIGDVKKQILKRLGRKMPQSKFQLIVQDRFRQAANYAKAQMLDPDMKAMYEMRINKKKQSAYAVAVSDALNAPKVKMIDTFGYSGAVGNVITIKATDDFRVVHVKVTITDGDGHVIETGEAIEDLLSPFLWNYMVKRTNRVLPGSTISATAFDFPGNETTLSKVLERSNSSLVSFDHGGIGDKRSLTGNKRQRYEHI